MGTRLQIPDDIAEHLLLIEKSASAWAGWLEREVSTNRAIDPAWNISLEFEKAEELTTNLRHLAKFCSWLASRDDQDRVPEHG